ncbi:hypothetical protein DPMN_167178 [Dreissena polymorpha]|uniref:Uncharacterized protein n=1 Tax=Dreissena polymorpha TaxID=45954 RepID=A0A9D4F2S7_DREPO|nr:hypothetical protein DPMN_167178 [Dreissena polymorpha]
MGSTRIHHGSTTGSTTNQIPPISTPGYHHRFTTRNHQYPQIRPAPLRIIPPIVPAMI